MYLYLSESISFNFTTKQPLFQIQDIEKTIKIL